MCEYFFVIDYRITGDHTGSFFGRPHGVAPTLYSVIGGAYPKFRITHYEFRILRNAEDSVPYELYIKLTVKLASFGKGGGTAKP